MSVPSYYVNNTGTTSNTSIDRLCPQLFTVGQRVVIRDQFHPNPDRWSDLITVKILGVKYHWSHGLVQRQYRVLRAGRVYKYAEISLSGALPQS